MWPYLLHYAGVIRLHDRSLRGSRIGALLRAGRRADYDAELRFSGHSLLRAPLLASRAVVVADEEFARDLAVQHPELRIHVVPPGPELPEAPTPVGPVTFGVTDATTGALAGRAAARARAAGARFELQHAASAADAVRASHVVLAMSWPPPAGPPAGAILAMSAARAVVVYETATTAAWPAIDPQTWEPRGLFRSAPPIVVSVDPRDDEHSLMLAMRRLSASADSRERLGRAAQAWWRGHATPRIAAAAWERVLREASRLSPPARPSEWPAHLAADGTQRARETLQQFGVSVDFLN
jgi:hypothetical protein